MFSSLSPLVQPKRDLAAENDDTLYRSISLLFSVSSQLDATPHKLFVGACT